MASRVISAVLKFKDQNFSKGLKDANKKAGDFGRHMQVAQNKVDEFNKKAKQSFKAIGIAAGALAIGGIAALSTSVVSTVGEMESAFDKLEARTGASGYKLEAYKDIAKDVFVNGLTENISEGSNLVGRLASMFPDAVASEIGKIANGSLGIAKVFDQEGTEVARAIKAMTTNFAELSNTDAADLITVAFQKTGDYANDVLDTFSEYSGYFKDVGMSGEQFTSMLIKGAEAGAWNIDKIGDAVKEFSIRSVDGSKSTAEGFAAIGLKASDMGKKMAQGGEVAHQAYMATISGLAAMKDPIKQNEAGVALFGTMWEDLRKDVVIAMSDSTSAVEGYQGATAKAVESLNSGPIAQLKKGWRYLVVGVSDMVATNPEIQNFMTSISGGFTTIIPYIESGIEKGIAFATTIKDNWGPLKETVIGITVAIAAFKTGMMAMTVVNTVTSFVKAYRTALAAGTVAQWAMNTAMSANPIGLVIAGIAALIAVGVLLYRNWDTVKEKASELWTTTKEVFGGIYDWGATKIQGVTNFFSGLYDKVSDFISKITSFKPPEWISKIGGAIGSAASKVGNFINGSHSTGLNRVPYDSYIAELHKDEMVVPAKQARNLRSSGANISNVDKVVPNKAIPKKTITSTPKGNGGGNTFNFGDIIVQGGEGSETAVKEFVHQVELALANM